MQTGEDYSAVCISVQKSIMSVQRRRLARSNLFLAQQREERGHQRLKIRYAGT